MFDIHRRRLLAGTLVASLLLAVAPSGSTQAAPQLDGKRCPKVGRARTVAGTTFDCRKVGRTTRWVRRESLTESGAFAPIEGCRDAERARNAYWQVSAGFPKYAERIPGSGTVNVLMLPVDFPDSPAATTPANDMASTAATVSSLFSDLSGGRLVLRFTTLPSYLRVSRPSTTWGMGSWGTGRGDVFVADIVAELDPVVDFSRADVLVVMPHRGITTRQIAYSPAMPYPAFAPLVTGERPIYSSTMMGADAWTDPLTLAHEFGHLLGWADLYALPWPAGPYEAGHAYVGKWDFMGFAWTRGVLGWQRWYQDWLDRNEVRCALNPGTYELTLAPLGGATTTPELLLLRGASGALVAVETRRPGATDHFVTAATQGALVYTIDANLITGAGPLRVIGRSADYSAYLADAPRRVGEQVVVDGWTITVLSSSAAGDTVRAVRG